MEFLAEAHIDPVLGGSLFFERITTVNDNNGSQTNNGHVFFAADLHLGDRYIARHRLAMGNPQQIAETIIANHNRIVAPNDTVYMLGDIVMGTGDMVRHLTSRLHGRKILIQGNHDRRKPPGFWLRAGFAEVHPLLDATITDAGRHWQVRMMHEPLPAGPLPDGIDAVLCGHIHDTRPAPPGHLCVCVELYDYQPIKLDKIIRWLQDGQPAARIVAPVRTRRYTTNRRKPCRQNTLSPCSAWAP